MMCTPRAACTLAGAALATAGHACLAVAKLAVERADGFFVEIGSHRFELPGSGMLGDAGTYLIEWGLLGLSCLGAAPLAILCPRIDDRAARGLVVAMLVFALAVAALFARSVSIL